MRNLLAGLIAIGLMPVAAQAQTAGQSPRTDEVTGYASASYGQTRVGVAGAGNDHLNTWSADGAVYLPWGEIGGMQLDVKGSRFGYDGVNANVLSTTAHIFGRRPDGLFGVFGGWSHTSDVSILGAGVEGQSYINRLTLYGSAGYGKLTNGADTKLWSGRAEARYFITDNFRVDAGADYLQINALGTHSHTWTMGAGAEYQLDKLPLSIFGRYEHGSAHDLATKSDTFKLGARVSFGGGTVGTLLERDRQGAGLANMNDLYGGSVVETLLAASSIATEVATRQALGQSDALSLGLRTGF